MGNGEVGSLEAEIVEVEDIDVDIAGAFVDGFDAAHGAFDALGAAEQFDGEVGRAGFDHHVEEVGLIEDVGRGGFDDGTSPDGFDSFVGEADDGFVEQCFPITEIGAETEVDKCQDLFSLALGDVLSPVGPGDSVGACVI
jgi:hypothetical protein